MLTAYVIFLLRYIGKKVCASRIRDAEMSWEVDTLEQGDTKKEVEDIQYLSFTNG